IPSEIVFRIILYLSCNDISNLRLTSGRMRFHCDQPYLWRSIYLRPSSPPLKEKNYTEGHATVLWKLTDLKKIIDVHLEHIKSIQIWGVRDNIVHYLLSSCPNLHHLTICGWATLSDHCLKVLPSQTPLKLRTLKLIGTSEQMNFVSVDASALGKLLVQTPDMTDLVFGCKMHIHADILLNELEQS
ncbi:hypothetical protein BDF20DRAFT_792940, partial [Mycotypha africana]|uniref:uncharacterized protein n=1 Tax=Mycotypha africana TaxID=64632 RepID=UPI0023011858